MIVGILTGIFSVGLSWRIVSWVRHRAERLGLMKLPNHRSSHELPTPSGGGLGIVATGTAMGAWWIDEPGFLSLLALGLLLAATALIDDIRHVPARIRFGIQIAVVASAVLCIGGLPEISNRLPQAFPLTTALLIVGGIWWINLFNFMDGTDGLAGIQAICMAGAAAALVVWSQPAALHSPLLGFTLCLIGATAGFLLWNWPPARIFMGDVGSTWLAFMLFILALMLIQKGWLSYAACSILGAVFITDATVTLVVRIVRGERWYEAHRSHAFQRLSRLWRGENKAGHRAVACLVMAIDVLWLTPLAMASLLAPDAVAAWLLMAYLPIVAGALWLGAGKPDHV